jgi:hypothetical protein
MSDLVGHIEALCANLEALGAGESPVVKLAREAAKAAPKPAAAPITESEAVAENARLKALILTIEGARNQGDFRDAQVARCDLAEIVGFWPAKQIAEFRADLAKNWDRGGKPGVWAREP